MFRRSSMIVAAFVAVTMGVASADAKVRPLTEKQAKAKTMQVIALERADKYGARELIGGPFKVSYNTCFVKTVIQADCSYYIKSVDPVKEGGGVTLYRSCRVEVTVKRWRGTGGKLARKRGAPKCTDRELSR